MRLYQVTLPTKWSAYVRHHNARQARQLAVRAKGAAGSLKDLRCVQVGEGLPNGRPGLEVRNA